MPHYPSSSTVTSQHDTAERWRLRERKLLEQQPLKGLTWIRRIWGQKASTFSLVYFLGGGFEADGRWKTDSWDQAYQRETENFLFNPEDEGIIWFDESGAEDRVINYLSMLDLPPAPSFLDLGTGNGHLLFEIHETGDYDDSTLVGIDYSEAAVGLARKIAKEREVDEDVKFEVADIIGEEMAGKDWVPEGGFDVVLDKGTYDAISLSDETLPDGRRIYEDYPRKVSSVLKKDGWLVITSCNWTEEELRAKMGVQKSTLLSDLLL